MYLYFVNLYLCKCTFYAQVYFCDCVILAAVIQLFVETKRNLETMSASLEDKGRSRWDQSGRIYFSNDQFYWSQIPMHVHDKFDQAWHLTAIDGFSGVYLVTIKRHLRGWHQEFETSSKNGATGMGAE